MVTRSSLVALEIPDPSILRQIKDDVIVVPKFTFGGERLMRWLCYACHVPMPHDATERNWDTDRFGLADLVAGAVLGECRALLRHGLRRDYRPSEQLCNEVT